ncbi:MAG: NAD(P)H-hydrate dehydratase [Bacteroidales bacterium]|nr:NAD(P)H-hydrate dehydratase [Bacteroidales bacterium]
MRTMNVFADVPMVKILSPEEIKAADAYTIAHEPVASVDLMERAASACAGWFIRHFDRSREIVVMCGHGNNGGDGLAIARMLHEAGYKVGVYLSADVTRLSPDAAANYKRLPGNVRSVLLNGGNMPLLERKHVLIDALFGVGLSRPPEGLTAQAITHINNSGATIVAIDVPSGLFCEDNTGNRPETIIHANYTLTFQQPKLSFFFAENAPFVGQWETLDIGVLPQAVTQQPSSVFMLSSGAITGWFAPRKRFSHKGDYGHACIVAGSRDMMGASSLAVRACLRAGAGLVTAHVPRNERLVIQLSAPEAIISEDPHPQMWSQMPDVTRYSAIAVGPGIGKRQKTRKALMEFLSAVRSGKKRCPPLVLDADALNILSESAGITVPDLLPAGSIITPHPKEFDRLMGGVSPFYDGITNAYLRWQKQKETAKKHNIVIVLKGAYTCIASPDACFFNTTGNPGMATAGSGDVLTGIIAALLAQGQQPVQAACAGVWLHGAAGDMAAETHGQQALIAGDIIEHIGKALKTTERTG